MKWHDIFGRWLRRPRPARPPAPRRRGLRLSLEQLEDRTVPSAYTAASVTDLIADINAANLTPEADTITLVAGKTFTLTAVNNTTDEATGLPVIAASEDLTIIGNGDILERSTAVGTWAFRLFDVAVGASLTLRNLTLQGGRLALGSGGAVFNQGTLILDGVTLQNNGAYNGGGAVGNYQGTVIMDGGILQDNFGDSGGAVDNSSGTLTLKGVTVQNNTAFGAGGGVYSSGALTVEGCTIRYNLAVGRRGSHGTSSCDIFGCHVSPGGPGGNGAGGGLYVAGGTATISDATLVGNTAQGGDGGDGFHAHSKDLSSSGGDGGNGFGGGLYVAGGAVTLHNSSVTGNSAKGGSGGQGYGGHPSGAVGQGFGGGIYIDTLALVGLDAFTVDHVKHNHAATNNDDIFGSYEVIV